MVSNRTMLMIGGAIAAIWAGGTFYLSGSPNGSPEAAQAQRASQKDAYPVAELMKPGTLPENSIGSLTAPVTIIEYSSMTCPHCASFHKDTLPDLKSKYIDKGKVRYIIREFPLGDLAAAAFMLARCAGPGKTIPLIELLYAKQDSWASRGVAPLPALRKITKLNAGMSKETFDKCLNDTDLLKKINETRKRGAETFGVSSTPTFFINGKVLKGGHSLEEVEKVMAPFLK